MMWRSIFSFSRIARPLSWRGEKHKHKVNEFKLQLELISSIYELLRQHRLIKVARVSPLSIKIGGWVASKFVRKSGGGFCMSTVVTCNGNRSWMSKLCFQCQQMIRHVFAVYSLWDLWFSVQLKDTSPWSTPDRTSKRPFVVHRLLKPMMWIKNEDFPINISISQAH